MGFGILSADAATLSFVRVTGNSDVDAAADLSVDLVDLGASSLFLVSNSHLAGSFINQIYVEDSGGGIASMSFSAALSTGVVDYGAGASPGSPPGLSPFSSEFDFDANPSKSANGVGPGEVAAFDLVHAFTYDFVEAGLKDGSIRVSLHAQGLDGGHSDTFVNLPLADTPIPEPGSLALVVVGGASCLLMRRRRPLVSEGNRMR